MQDMYDMIRCILSSPNVILLISPLATIYFQLVADLFLLISSILFNRGILGRILSLYLHGKEIFHEMVFLHIYFPSLMTNPSLEGGILLEKEGIL